MIWSTVDRSKRTAGETWRRQARKRVIHRVIHRSCGCLRFCLDRWRLELDQVECFETDPGKWLYGATQQCGDTSTRLVADVPSASMTEPTNGPSAKARFRSGAAAAVTRPASATKAHPALSLTKTTEALALDGARRAAAPRICRLGIAPDRRGNCRHRYDETSASSPGLAASHDRYDPTNASFLRGGTER
jgi:hypothetical protein